LLFGDRTEEKNVSLQPNEVEFKDIQNKQGASGEIHV
jgi:hypothetical protein